MKTKIGLIQMACTSDVRANLEKCLGLLEQAALQGAKIISTQELFTSLYFCQREDHEFFKLAESIPGPSTEALAGIAAKHEVVIVGSLFERRAPGLYHNTAVVIDADGSILGKYRKMHIPDDPFFYEKFYFTPGDLGFRSFETRYGKVGVLICWDQWYPEGARLTALSGAQIIFFPTAIGWQPAEFAEFGAVQHSSWETIQRSHAIANGVYIAAPNRVGHEHGGDPSTGIRFWGQSFVADPAGTIIAKAGIESEEILLADVDFDKIDIQRTHWPFLRDRRIDAYGDITRRLID